MSQFEAMTTQTGATTNHDRTPIHLVGSIQPHGVLLAINDRLEIVQVSNNTQEYLDIYPEDLLGQPLEALFSREQVQTIAPCLTGNLSSIHHIKLSVSSSQSDRYFDGIAHRTADGMILELEPIDSSKQMSFISFHGLMAEAIAKLQQTSNLPDFLQLVASEFRKIAEFDRVMVYQFDSVGAGNVIAEAKREDLSPYLGLHYPATDIPEPSRELYLRQLLRYIPNFNVEPIELIPILNPTTGQPLDLSLSVLRSIDPCCVAFHQNMGLAAILVMALVKDGQLWGLISCHHHTPKYVAYELRTAYKFLGQIVSSELAAKASHEELDYQVKLKSLQSEFLASIAHADNFIEALIKPEIRLLGLVSAAGAAVCLEREITLIGTTPDIEQVGALIEWANTQVKDNLFATDCLPKLYPEAKVFKNTASGLLLLRISQVRRYYILWFRPEVIQTVNWAGDPNESIKIAPDSNITLCPRQSFKVWQETVKFTSLAWKECELDSALALRNAIVGIVLSKADELAKINQELERSNKELASFAYAASHDLKEPLRGIYNYSTILLEDYGQLLDEEGIETLQTVLSLSQRMETLINALLRLSQLGQTQLHLQTTDLNQLLQEAIALFRASRQVSSLNIRIPKPMPTIQCDPILVNEVFSNLIANGLKYNDRDDKWVEIGCLEPEKATQDASSPVFYIQDNGIGIEEHHYQIIFRLFKRLHSQEKYGGGAGSGLAITKKIIERHGGRIWVESIVGEGSRFYFTLG